MGWSQSGRVGSQSGLSREEIVDLGEAGRGQKPLDRLRVACLSGFCMALLRGRVGRRSWAQRGQQGNYCLNAGILLL